MNVYAVTVTYGNRFHLVKKVMDELIDQGIHRIVVVDNNSNRESRRKLDEIAKRSSQRIIIIGTSENSGSAAGYKRGIDFSQKQKDCDFIWLLDDDNKPDSHALHELETAWNEIDHPEKNRTLCLASFRSDRPAYLRAVSEGNPSLVLGENNMFRSFHVASSFQVLFKRLSGKNDNPAGQMKKIGPVSVVPYGGMYFHKDLIKLIGLPDESYYLYVDDHEYSYRVNKKGGSLYLVTTSVITDIDKSWHVGSDVLAYKKIALDDNYIRLYYTIRNRIYFEKCELVTNKAVYFLNLAIYSLFVCSTALIHLKFNNCAIYLKALFRGWNGRMGVDPDFKLT